MDQPLLLAPVTVLPLGEAWAANSVNTCIYRGSGVVTAGSWQFAAWFIDRHRMAILRRDLQSGANDRHVLSGTYAVDDAHNAISLGVDAAGHIHLSYDHHTHPLRYRRSLAPWMIDRWSEPVAMTGVREDRVTYPVFLPLNSGIYDLLFLYRDGVSGNGDLCVKGHEATTGAWRDLALPLIQGSGQQPFTTNAYWDRPAIDADGALRLSFTWRVNGLFGWSGPWFNRDLCHLRWRPGDSVWQTASGAELPLPASPVTAETVWPVAPFRELINSCGAALDRHGRLHVVHWAADDAGVPQYWHLWQAGTDWRRTCLSRRRQRFTLSGPGFLQLPIGRPEIVIDDADQVFVIQRGDHTGDTMAVQRLVPPDYQPPGSWRTLWPEPLGHCEPVLDPLRWTRDRILALYLQANAQPQHDEPTPHPPQPAFVAEWRLEW